MSFQPAVGATGNLGWTLLKNSRAFQQEAFERSPGIQTNTEYFRNNIQLVSSADQLVSDRRLLTVALGAFGLDDDIDNLYFIKTVLEEGSLQDDALANRLSDKRYLALANAFGFHLSPPNTVLSDFPNAIVRQYNERQFEIAVGDQDENLRLALGVAREVASLDARGLAEDTAWFTVMGNPPLRRVFETALGMPPQLAAIDIDQQLAEFRQRSENMFGVTHPEDFTNPDLQEKLVRNFLVRAESDIGTSANASGSIALTLLQTSSLTI